MSVSLQGRGLTALLRRRLSLFGAFDPVPLLAVLLIAVTESLLLGLLAGH